ncbi:MAG: DUF302 domain-containing protein [Chitinivibrionales bacterium]|nr:DUF302 domain-containing protein [Chitinivibrionales bacterium]
MSNYGFIKEIDASFEDATELVTQELKKEGFGVLTTIDMHDKLNEKLGINFKKYRILGACNPPLAHQAVSAEENIGLLLPCNVIVYENGDKSTVGVMKPSVAMSMVENDQLRPIAGQVEEKLKRVFDAI